MKKLSLTLAAFAALIVCESVASAQCVIDYDFGDLTFGVSPDPAQGETFVPGMLGEDYYDVLHILIPTTAADIDTTFPPTLPVDSVVVLQNNVDANGLYSGVVFTDTLTNEQFFADEIGLEWVYNNNGDSGNPMGFLGGQQYCGSLQGVPSRSGIYRIRIDVLGWATIFSPFNAPYSFDNFTFRVNCPLIDGVDIVQANSVTGVDGQLTVVLGEGVVATEILWFNQYGVEIGSGESVTVDNPGTFAVQVTTEDCQSMFEGWVVIDESLECEMTATVETTPADLGMYNGSATLTVENASGDVSVTWYSANNLIVGTGLTVNGLAAGTYSALVLDDAGCSVEVTDVVINEVDGIANATVSAVKMHPNPATSFAFLDLQQPSNVTVRAVGGVPVWAGVVGPGMPMDVQSWPAGLYFVTVERQGGFATSRLIVSPR